jgi:hypothetical protein
MDIDPNFFAMEEVRMFTRTITICFAAVMLAGCTSSVRLPALSANHPASPDAPEAALPAQSPTLALTASPNPDETRHDAAEMKHDMKHMGHPTPPTQPGENAAPSAPRFTPTSVPATTQASVMFTCPMHPEVVSTTPGNCPKCGMKLVPSTASEMPVHRDHGGQR